jgi:hypothetical protein
VRGTRSNSETRFSLFWPGRQYEPRTLGGPAEPPKPLETLEKTPGEPAGRLVFGDALDVAHHLLAEGLEGKVDLVYIDPPFASQADYVHEARLDGPADGRVVRTLAYGDSWRGVSSYLEEIAPRLEALVRLLAPTGTIWVHLDWRASYLVRVLLEEMLGRDAFVNEIVWRRAPNLGRQAASHQFGRTLDTILVYGKDASRVRLSPPTRLEPIDEKAIRWDDEGRPFTTAPRGDYTDLSISKLEKEGRVHRTATGRVYIKYFLVKGEGGGYFRERRVDALWTDVPPLRHAATTERTGFPTQKPRALLDRIVRCASPPGGLVVDLFSGSGTTAESAHALGRRFIAGDAGAPAIATARARLLRAGAPFTLERCALDFPRGAPPRIEVTEDRVRLLEPREPSAWAIDPDARTPFHIGWHAERVPGARPIPAAREATIARGARMSVRVYGDDGSLATVTA